MHRLLRPGLASLVCPSAPFLAPRLLRATVPIAVSLAGPPRATAAPRSQYATHAKGKGTSRNPSWVGKKGTKDRRAEDEASQEATARLYQQFRQACEVRNAHHVMDLYPTLLEAGALRGYDTRRITQALHVRMRNIRAESTSSDLFLFVQQIINDIRRGALPPNPYAFVHILSIYRDTKRFQEGYELWQWLVEQDEHFVSQATYGAAIELMAYGRIMSLPDLEHVYAEALKRFPGTFAEYHLSPDAIVPDRTQPIAIPGIPTVLLQGILTARILARDWKRAYLAMDTALRLFPTQTPRRYYELFMTERPMSEAYTACMVACRAGVTIAPSFITALITKMRAAIAESPSMADRMMLVRAISNALYAHMQAGGRLDGRHVGGFIHALEQLLPDKLAGDDYQGEAAELRDIIVVTAHDIMTGLIQTGMSFETFEIHAFESLISLAGKLGVPALLTTTLQDVEVAGLELGPVGIRSAITSAGLVQDKALIEKLWERLVSAAEAESVQIPFEDWITFTKACRRAKHSDYFRAQLSRLPHAISTSIEQHLLVQIDQQETVAPGLQVVEYMLLEDLKKEVEALKMQMKDVEAVAMSGQALDLSKSPFYMHIDPEHPTLGSKSDLRAIYDEMTTDPHQPPPPPPAEGSPIQTSLSPTGIPLDELRFQNWCTVLEMMDEAELYEFDFQSALNAAIKARVPFKRGPELLRLRKDKSAPPYEAGSLRHRIKSLRATSATDVRMFRKVGYEGSEKNHNRSMPDGLVVGPGYYEF